MRRDRPEDRLKVAQAIKLGKLTICPPRVAKGAKGCHTHRIATKARTRQIKGGLAVLQREGGKGDESE